jgi:hypothetical protein
MKKVLFLASSIVMLSFSSWTHPSTIKSLSLPPEHWNEHIIEDASGVFYNACTGEMVDLTLTFYWLNTGTSGPNRSGSVWNFKWKGTGVGLTTGIQYIVNEHDNSIFTIHSNNDQLVLSGQHKMVYVSKGAAPNWTIQWNYQLIINANGEVVVDDFEATDYICK